jgi:regulator of protease activity HflC (stomatin/prohibitin superfamily)
MIALTIVMIVLACLILNSCHRVPANNFGEPRWFGRRSRRTVSKDGKGGIYFYVPGILGGSIEPASLVPVDIPNLKVKFLTRNTFDEDVATATNKNKGRLEATATCYFQYAANSRMEDSGGHNTFLGSSVDAIQRNIEASLESKMGAFGALIGSHELNDIRKPIEDFILASLHCTTPPHKSHKTTECGVDRCDLPEQIPVGESLLRFYQTHWQKVAEAIKKAKGDPKQHSDIETANGVDALSFRIKDIDFSLETKKSLAEEAAQRARLAAAENQLEYMGKVSAKLPQLPQRDVLHAAQIAVGGVPAKIEIIDSDVPVFALKNLGGGVEKAVTTTTTTGDGGKKTGGGRKGGRR